MSRYITRNDDGTVEEEIHSMELCKWLTNDMCCNDSCELLGWFPSPMRFCENDKYCKSFEKENGVIDG